MGVPDNQSSQNSNKRQRSLKSQGNIRILDARQPIAQSALKVPRFLVVQSTDPSRKVADLSPYVIDK